MKAIILAGGFGKRLYPETKEKPKALLELGGKTLLDHLMERLEKDAPFIKEITVITNALFYLQFFDWRKRRGYSIKKVRIEANHACIPEKKVGIVRDLLNAMKIAGPLGEGYFVFHSDHFFNFSFAHFFHPCLSHSDHAFLAACHLKEGQIGEDTPAMILNHHTKFVGFETRSEAGQSSPVSIGLYYFPEVFKLRMLEYLEIERRDSDSINEFIAWLGKKDPLYAVECDGTFFDLNTLSDYQNAKDKFEKKGSE